MFDVGVKNFVFGYFISDAAELVFRKAFSAKDKLSPPLSSFETSSDTSVDSAAVSSFDSAQLKPHCNFKNAL